MTRVSFWARGESLSENPEKRKAQRQAHRQPVEIYPIFPSYPQYENTLGGVTRDISEGGLGLNAEKPLLPGSLLKVCFKGEDMRKVEAYGKIAWANETVCGISFFSFATHA